jgi:ribosomal protein S18 acetylase RimI-like enzyme
MPAMSIAIANLRSWSEIQAARTLFKEYAEALPFGLGYQNFEAELAGLPAPYIPPAGCLLFTKRNSGVVGVVGLKPLGPGVAEIKRLHVVPVARRPGLGRALLERALNEARQNGYERVQLDSHHPSMTTAIAVYRSLGFVEIPPYGPDLNGEIVFFEKRL